MKKEVHSLAPAELEHFLERRRHVPPGESADIGLANETSLVENMVEILHRANEFVSSDAGSILLDDPTLKAIGERHSNTLTFIAAFGEKAGDLPGRGINATEGIAGHVYLAGEPYFTGDAHTDRLHHKDIDEATTFQTQSLIAIPIRLGDEVCGVLELIREKRYTQSDCDLLGIFARYLSVSIQNVLDARHAQHMAKRDNLTGLYNDRYLHVALGDCIDSCVASGDELSMVFIDLDYFKSVNDNFGHLAGSQVLREVGALLENVMSPRGGLGCRYGGDEFLAILPGCELERAVELADEFRGLVESKIFCDSVGSIQTDPLHLHGLSCSIGVATLRRHVEDMSVEHARTALLHAADAAMYVAKETGRNQVVVAGTPLPEDRPSVHDVTDAANPDRRPPPGKGVYQVVPAASASDD